MSRDVAVDFSQYSSWTWHLVDRDAEEIRDDLERQLGELVYESIHRELAARGFRYQSKHADLGVDARLVVAREQHVIHRTSAVETLNSLHSSPSFEIQATERDVVIYERGRLTIEVRDLRRDREVWRGEFEGRFEDEFAPHVEEAVARTLESFPTVPSEAPPDDPGSLAIHSR